MISHMHSRLALHDSIDIVDVWRQLGCILYSKTRWRSKDAMTQLYESASAARKRNAPTRLKSSTAVRMSNRVRGPSFVSCWRPFACARWMMRLPQVSGSASASAAGNGESSSVGRRKTSDVSLAQRQIGRDLETTSRALDSHSQPP